MTESPLAVVQRLFIDAVDGLRGVAESGSDDERVAVLRLCEGVARQLDQVTVATVAGLDRDGVFTGRRYKSAAQALSDLSGWGAVRGLRDNLPGEIDLLFLDGAKEMYCEVLAMLEPRLAPGALVVADNACRAPDFLEYVRSSGRYLSADVGGDVEVALLV